MGLSTVANHTKTYLFMYQNNNENMCMSAKSLV